MIVPSYAIFQMNGFDARCSTIDIAVMAAVTLVENADGGAHLL